jgi:HK97 family phage prohead protease
VTELYSAHAGGVALRFNAQRPELREASGVKHIAGYASVFGRKSRNLGGFVEQIDRRAFDQAELAGWPDVICRYNHDDNYLLGTTRGNTLTLRTDDQGLWYDCLPPSFRADIVELCARGDVTQSSFAFRVPDNGDYWERSGPGGMPLRTVTNTELVDVAPVNTPAYSDATASARSFDDDLIHSLARLKECSPAEVRNYLNEAGNVAKFFKRTDQSFVLPGSPNREGASEVDTEEDRKKLTSKERNDLSPSDFAYIDPDGKGHFPIHDANHVRNALARIAQGAQYGKEALPKVKAAAKKFGIDSEEKNALMLDAVEELRIMLEDMFDEDEEIRGDLPPWLQKAKDKKDGKDDDSEDDDEDDDKSDAKDKKPAEKKSADEEAEDRAKADAVMVGGNEKPAEDDEEDEDDDADARAAIEAEHQEMRDRLLRHRLDDFDPYAGLVD